MQQNAQKGRLTLKKKAIANLLSPQMGDIFLPLATIPVSYVMTCKQNTKGE